MGAHCYLMFQSHTLALLGLSLLIWPPIYTSLKYFVLALKFILELVLKISHFVLVDFHGTVAIFDCLELLLLLCGSFRHIRGSFWV
jgi:hypothetical protein